MNIFEYLKYACFIRKYKYGLSCKKLELYDNTMLSTNDIIFLISKLFFK